MTISIVSWADHPLNDGTVYEAGFVGNPFARQSQPVQVAPPGAWARHIRSNQQQRSVTVVVLPRSGTLTERQRELQQWFATGTEGTLVIDDDGTRKELECVATGVEPYSPSVAGFQATLIAADPRWRASLPSAAARSCTASGQTFIATNPGNSPVDDAVLTLRPYAQKTAANGQLYKLEAVVAWKASRPSGYYAIDVTGGGWAHSTEVGAGRSQADGDDVRVLVDGIEQPYWFGEHADNDPNSALTKIWTNLTYSPVKTASLLANITAVSPGADGDLEVRMGGTRGWPATGGALLLGDEVFTYAGLTTFNANGAEAFTGVRRAQRATTAAAHTAADTLYYIEHRIQIVYGHTGAAAITARADLKPLLDLTSNTVSNSRHEWINFCDDTYPGRSMQWLRRIRAQDDQYDKVLAAGGSPASAMTFEYQSGGAVAGKPVGNTWYRDIPTGTGSSGGNVASLTRAISDTLGMWAYGIDDAGAEVVLEKYAGALASGSDNITAPTNPVYRLEFWGFNQVIANGQLAGAPLLGVMTLTGTFTNHAQQIVCGDEPLEMIAFQIKVTDSVGGNDVYPYVAPDNSNVPVSGNQFGNPVTTSNAGAQFLTFATTLSDGYYPLRQNEQYWVYVLDIGTPDEAWWYYNQSYQRAERSGTVRDYEHFHLTVYGRPATLAASFVRCDDQSYADDGDTVSIDGVTVHLDTAYTPYVSLKARESSYRYGPCTIYNETTGQRITVDARSALHDEIVIDIGARSATNVDEEDGTHLAQGSEGSGVPVEFSDAGERFTLLPGDNVIQVVDPGLAGLSVALSFAGAWE